MTKSYHKITLFSTNPTNPKNSTTQSQFGLSALNFELLSSLNLILDSMTQINQRNQTNQTVNSVDLTPILFLIPLGERVRKRHRHEADKGKGMGFAVPLEVFTEDERKVVTRYDSAHGYSHMDRFYRDGRRVKKDLHLNLKEALTLADEDIKDNWKAYQGAFMEGK
jgi:hypothetical protein